MRGHVHTALGELLEVVLRLDFFDLRVDEALRVQLLCVDALQMLLHCRDALLGLHELCLHDNEGLLLILQLTVERAVRLIGKLGKIIEAG